MQTVRETNMWSIIVTHPIVVHRLLVLVHMISLSLVLRCCKKIADHVVFDAAAMAVGGGTDAGCIDSEMAVGHLSSYLGVDSISLSRIQLIQMSNYTL